METAAEYKSLGTKSISVSDVLINLKVEPEVALNIAFPFIDPVSQHVTLLCVDE